MFKQVVFVLISALYRKHITSR